MSDLEFDIMGVGYAAGYGSALSGFVDHPVDVLISRHDGHLYSALASGGRSRPFAPLEVSTASWSEVILPRLASHRRCFEELAGERARYALVRARELFAECVALHHGLLLPARRAIADLVALSSGLFSRSGQEPGPHLALAAATAIETPTVRAADRLMDPELPDMLDDTRVIELASDGAPDGDGYGLVLPGWLDDAAFGHRARGLLRRFSVTREMLRTRREATLERRSEAVAALDRRCPRAMRPEYAAKLAAARTGSVLAEEHGPVMHTRYIHELRRLVLAHGQQQCSRGLLDDPRDIAHLRLSEIGGTAATQALGGRRARYLRHLHATPPAAHRRSMAPAQSLPLGVAAHLDPLCSHTGQRTADRSWQAAGAAPGSAQGPLKVVRAQEDLDRLEPGDIAVVPDDGARWGWLAVGGLALIIERGGLFGHAPAVARECGTACVVGGSGLAALLRERVVVKVSGDTGEVTW